MRLLLVQGCAMLVAAAGIATALLLQQEATTLATAVTQDHALSLQHTSPGRIPGSSRVKPGCRVLLPGALQLSIHKTKVLSAGKALQCMSWLSPGHSGNLLAQLDNARLVLRLGCLWHWWMEATLCQLSPCASSCGRYTPRLCPLELIAEIIHRFTVIAGIFVFS